MLSLPGSLLIELFVQRRCRIHVARPSIGLNIPQGSQTKDYIHWLNYSLLVNEPQPPTSRQHAEFCDSYRCGDLFYLQTIRF